MLSEEWILCPICGNKTRVRIRKDTVWVIGFWIKNIVGWNFKVCNQSNKYFKFWIATTSFYIEYGT